ncbi:hypothetical protein GCM10009764_31830 [Nocardia ninae]|uniref:Uncharacterized protein n=1 Tax=Nocardia ninae NBRC 108245 TaxID=1210091 RepID=A0A511MHX4_9NOCA|nr:hypothetical protein NN4_40350 [Nocardia ninae NBRC 108245]
MVMAVGLSLVSSDAFGLFAQAVLGPMALLAGAATAAWGVVYLLKSTPELVIDACGIQHRLMGHIAFSEISAVNIVTIGHIPHLAILLNNPGAVSSRTTLPVRMFAALSRFYGNSPAVISALQIRPATLDYVITEMQRRYPALVILSAHS